MNSKAFESLRDAEVFAADLRSLDCGHNVEIKKFSNWDELTYNAQWVVMWGDKVKVYRLYSDSGERITNWGEDTNLENLQIQRDLMQAAFPFLVFYIKEELVKSGEK